MEQTSETCQECWRFKERRYGNDRGQVNPERLKPKEPEGPACAILFSWAAVLLLGGWFMLSSAAGDTSTLLGVIALSFGIACAIFGFSWLPYLISRNIIGYPMFVFADQGAGLHQHLTEPTGIAVDGKLKRIADVHQHQKFAPGTTEANLHLVADAPILKLRVGGWFRRCAFIKHHGWKNTAGWSIAQCWRGLQDLVIRDCDGGEIGSRKFTIEEILATVGSYHCVSCIINDVKCKQDEVRGLQGRAHILVDDRDHLGTAIFVTLGRIQRDRKALGQSKHAQRIREHFERVLAALSDDRREALLAKWGKHAAEIIDAEGAEKAATAAAVPPVVPTEAQSAPAPEASAATTT